MVLHTLAERFRVDQQAIWRGLVGVKLAGRFQVIPGPVEYILDVAHNPQATGILAQILRQRRARGRTHILIGMLKDKDACGVFRALTEQADYWHVVGLGGTRGATSEQLAYDLIRVGVTASIVTYNDIGQALAAIQSQTVTGDRVLITGSFLTVAGGMKLLEIPPFYEV